ncbi:MAG: metal ABC transporter permease [Magnetovibrio sp.]|nr:metal ABC transporter permease [Magnetovibrio sp.]
MRSQNPGSAPTATRNDLNTIRAMLPYIWPEGAWSLRARVLIALVLLVLAKVANVSVPMLYKHAVDALNDTTAELLAVPIGVLLAYGVLRVLSEAFGELRDAVFTRVAQRAIRLAGLKTFRHLHALSLRFHLDRKTGGIARAVERGTKGIEFLLRFMLFNILPTLIEILMVCAILWKLYGWYFAALTLLTLVAYIGWTTIITEWRTRFRRAMNDTDSEANTKAIDSLLNFETVKFFGNEDHEARRFDAALRRYEDAAIKSGGSLALLNIGQSMIIAAGVSSAMILAGFGVVDDTMTMGDFVLINAYLLQMFMPLTFLGFVYREIKRALTDMETMFQILAENTEIKNAPNANELKIDAGHITFNGVTFDYDSRRPVLKGVSFQVPSGKTVAIVGASGSGKSTISRLLFRFYDITSGTITIDGQDIRDVTQESLRGAIGMVPQDTVLFNDSIYYNIAYGRPEASPAEVENAASLAHIHDFIMGLPDGYQSTVGERGLKLSGGERQRIAIARTVLKNPQILIFDEATSALDSRTEQGILAALRDVSENRTTLTIAHRLSTIIEADEILVLSGGVIIERGRHLELLAADGVYAGMWNRQQAAAEAARTLRAAET